MISRSLGPEFGGSIGLSHFCVPVHPKPLADNMGPPHSKGLVFYLGQALNAAMNVSTPLNCIVQSLLLISLHQVLGFVEALTDSFGESKEGNVAVLPEGPVRLVFLTCSSACHF